MTTPPTVGNEPVRAFIALELNDDVRSALARTQDGLRRTGAHVSWVRPSNIHLTLAFLGDVALKRLDKLATRLDVLAGGLCPFDYTVSGVGAFGSARSPRVVWVGASEAQGLLEGLHGGLVTVLEQLGFDAEKRKFKPHLTLGRVRSSRGVDELTSALASAKNSVYGVVHVDRLLLMRSRLSAQGAEYTVLHASPLKGVVTHGRENLQSG